MVTAKAMNDAFHETGSGSQLMVILTDEKGLGPADEATYRTLIDNLHQDTQDKMSVQDFISAPPMREILASKDNKAWNLPINMPGEVAAPETLATYQHVYQIVNKTLAGTTLTAHFAGGVATTADMTMLGEHDAHVVEIGTGLLVLLILLVIYRNLVTMLVPLATIGLSLVTAQGVIVRARRSGLAHRHPDHHVDDCGIGRGGNRLRGVSDQPLSRLCAAGRGFGSSGQKCLDVHRQGHRRVRSHRGGHLYRDGFRQVGRVFDGRPGDFDLHHGGVPGGGDAASRDPGAGRAAWLDQAATRADHPCSGGGPAHALCAGPDPSGRECDCAHHRWPAA